MFLFVSMYMQCSFTVAIFVSFEVSDHDQTLVPQCTCPVYIHQHSPSSHVHVDTCILATACMTACNASMDGSVQRYICLMVH